MKQEGQYLELRVNIIDAKRVENIFMVGVHSILQSDELYLDGRMIDKLGTDPALLAEQNKLIEEIRNNSDYKNKPLNENFYFDIQFGGKRAPAEMWRQALEVWEWADEHSATWEMAFNELTWVVRSIGVFYKYKVDYQGEIYIEYNFTDTLDLRPDWHSRSYEYNAICTVLGFLYHDALGGNNELKIKARWTNYTPAE